jgi:hypothetical protein
MKPITSNLELLMTTNDLLLRCIDILDQAPELTLAERKEAEKLQMLAAQALDIGMLNKNNQATFSVVD